jgi:hypothetical protein
MRRLICTDCGIVQDAEHTDGDPCLVCGSDAIEPISDSADSPEITGLVDASPRLDESLVFEVGDELHSGDEIRTIQKIKPVEGGGAFWLIVGKSASSNWLAGSIAVSIDGDQGSYELVKDGETDESANQR